MIAVRPGSAIGACEDDLVKRKPRRRRPARTRRCPSPTSITGCPSPRCGSPIGARATPIPTGCGRRRATCRARRRRAARAAGPLADPRGAARHVRSTRCSDRQPFIVLAEDERRRRALAVGPGGADLDAAPRLPEAARDPTSTDSWDSPGPPRCCSPTGSSPLPADRAALCTEVRVRGDRRSGADRVAAVRPLVSALPAARRQRGDRGGGAAGRAPRSACHISATPAPIALGVGLMSTAVFEFDSQVTIRQPALCQRGERLGGDRGGRRRRQPVVLVGPLIHLEERERAHVVGSWVDDSRYGMQVKVSEARPLPPTDVESVTMYLRRVKHVGAKRAAKLIERYGAHAVLDAIDADPHAAFAGGGAAPRRGATRRPRRGSGCASRAGCICCSRRTGSLTWCRGSRTPTATSAHRVVSERPYELTSVFGVGLPHRRPDRARTRRRRRRPRASARCRPARAVRGRAQRQHVPADRLAARHRSTSCSARPPTGS